MLKPERNSGEGKAAVSPSGLLWGKPGGVYGTQGQGTQGQGKRGKGRERKGHW